MSYLTNWGYEFTTAEAIPEILTSSDFNTMTGNKYAGDARIAPALQAASLALQNYCGWHLIGSLACKITWNIKDRGIVRTGNDLIVQLPAKVVSSITSVKVAGETTTDYYLNPNGHLTIYDAFVSDRRDFIEVVYTAGMPNINGIKELVSQMVIFNLSKSNGITSEAAGGVSITYNSSWTNGSFDRILDNNAALLAPYKLRGVF